MTVSFLPVEIILMKRKRQISLLCLKTQKGRYWYNQFCFFTHKVTPSWLGLDVAPEISGSLWCPSFEEDNLVLFKWAREGPRHEGTQRTRSGFPDERLRWPHHYGNSVSMLVRQEGRGHRYWEKWDPTKTGLNQLKSRWCWVRSGLWPLTLTSSL